MKYVTLSNGVKMPMLGYGVYQVSKDECERCVLDALSLGYRHIDTAQSYFNEEEVGNAIVKSGIPREEIFITTKVWLEHYGYEETKKSIYDSLCKLQTSYIDLVLLHQPFADIYGAWRALEDLYADGKIKAIGISNFYPDRMIDICSFARIKPMVNQIELHPLNQQIDAQKWNEKYGVQVEAWAPFGEGRGGLFTNEVIAEIGKKYNKTNAQVILRWELQRGIVIIPKSVHKERMAQNLDVFDFELTEEDMKVMSSLDKQESSFFSHRDPNMVEWFAKMVEERKHNKNHKKEKKNW
ncbi:MAG: aldo/keto reductase [Anaeroplasmataceae bacterium]|nr:aldo/keto reductase [Anaeroplasmataceae bacterium]